MHLKEGTAVLVVSLIPQPFTSLCLLIATSWRQGMGVRSRTDPDIVTNSPCQGLELLSG
jgi:hypothetical protein